MARRILQILVADLAVDLVRAELLLPVDRALLEHGVAADAVGRHLLVGGRHAEDRAAAAECEVLLLDLADHGGRAPAVRAATSSERSR